ncbi:MAG: hypothetical protein QOD40_3104 [Alphaproteobacteria bacterium]|jgi:uncharacterized tellurite resistance protein B-like protein|nr:hypothetical protein [Alphaproteobacteria bacterium]
MSILPDEVHELFRKKATPDSPPTSIALSVPELDHHDDGHHGHQLVAGQVELAEGQSFIITYRDASGQVSTRPITVWAIRTSAEGIPVLVAKCHLRNATRYFRLDRIEVIADFDGVVHEPMDIFLRDTFGIDWSPGKRYEAAANSEAEEEDEVADPWTLIRRVCRASGAQLLCAVGLADGELVPVEIDAIVEFLEGRCRESKIELNQAHSAQLKLYVKRMRPTPEVVEKAMDRLMHSRPVVISEVIDACVRIMDADGRRHNAEITLLQTVAQALRTQAGAEEKTKASQVSDTLH